VGALVHAIALRIGATPKHFRRTTRIAISSGDVRRLVIMLKWALILGIVALIAGALGFTGIAGAAAGIAKFLFFLFLAIVAVLLILGFFVGKKVTGD
jgi:uncharacterized membrane protein YtjA (UPF0391 family)